MPKSVIAYKIFIAAPSDTKKERKEASKIINEWNRINTDTKDMILRDLRWEHDAIKIGGETASAQETINVQLLREADFLVGIFKNRIGTPTKEYISGAVEEVKRHSEAGKPYMLFFCEEPIPRNISKEEREQLSALEEFRKRYGNVLYSTYTPGKFKDEFRIQLGKWAEREFHSVPGAPYPAYGRENDIEETLHEMERKNITLKIREFAPEQGKYSENSWPESQKLSKAFLTVAPVICGKKAKDQALKTKILLSRVVYPEDAQRTYDMSITDGYEEMMSEFILLKLVTSYDDDYHIQLTELGEQVYKKLKDAHFSR